MITVRVVADPSSTLRFVADIKGPIANRRGLNAALAGCLAEELKAHFDRRQSEPNKMRAPKTGFWADMAEATAVSSVTDTGAVVTVADFRFRIQVQSGVIRPTGGRHWLTIPLIPEARGLRVAEYEHKTGHKLFRLHGSRVLAERSALGDRSTIAGNRVTVRKRNGGFARVEMREGSLIRTVYALAEEAHIPADPRALPPTAELLEALREEARSYLATHQPTSA